MKKVVFQGILLLVLVVAASCWVLYSMSPVWTAPVCANCAKSLLGTMKYRLDYLRAGTPGGLETYDDKWFKFSYFKNMEVDVDEIANVITVDGYVGKNGEFVAKFPATVANGLVIHGSEEPAPRKIPELTKGIISGSVKLPDFMVHVGEVVPYSFKQVKMRDGSIAVTFVSVSERKAGDTGYAPTGSIYGYYLPASNHLLEFSANLGCETVEAKRQMAIFHQVLSTFEVKSQWKWKTKTAVSDGEKINHKWAKEMTDYLFRRANKMEQHEAEMQGNK